MQKVLTMLWEARILANINKCKLYVTEIKYLGLIVGTKGIKIDLSKVDAIKLWDTLTCVRKVCSLIGFYNFYC